MNFCDATGSRYIVADALASVAGVVLMLKQYRRLTGTFALKK